MRGRWLFSFVDVSLLIGWEGWLFCTCPGIGWEDIQISHCKNWCLKLIMLHCAVLIKQ